MLLDLDRFKAVNDTHGHGVGDVLLKQVADRIQSLIRSPDTAVRLGGEEFVVLMPNTPEAAAIAATERLCAKLGGEPYDVSNGVDPLTMTVSIGVATAEAGTLGLADLLSKADAALYKAKSSGRNRFVVASNAENAPIQLGGRPLFNKHRSIFGNPKEWLNQTSPLSNSSAPRGPGFTTSRRKIRGIPPKRWNSGNTIRLPASTLSSKKAKSSSAGRRFGAVFNQKMR